MCNCSTRKEIKSTQTVNYAFVKKPSNKQDNVSADHHKMKNKQVDQYSGIRD